MLKFKCKSCEKKHVSSRKISLYINNVLHTPESVNGKKAVFTFNGNYFCDEDCFINYCSNK